MGLYINRNWQQYKGNSYFNIVPSSHYQLDLESLFPSKELTGEAPSVMYPAINLWHMCKGNGSRSVCEYYE